MSELIRTEELSIAYREKNALLMCSLTLETGKIVGLLGSNGAGKSTLLKAMAGLLPPDKGAVYFEGRPLTCGDRARIAYMGDRSALSPGLGTEDALRFYADLYPDFDEKAPQELLRRFGMLGNERVGNLSRGGVEKLNLVLLLGRRVKLYLLDEPLDGVDPVARAEILNLLLEFMDGEKTIVMATHLVHDIEPVLDEAVFLMDGAPVLHQGAEELRERYGRSVEEQYMAVYGGRLGV